MSSRKKFPFETLGSKLFNALKGIAQTVGKRFEEKGISLTLEEYFVLMILDSNEGIILKELAEMLDKDKSGVVRHIDSLEEKHFVARAVDPADKRRKTLLITKQGMNELQKARQLDEEVHRDLTRDIEVEKLRDFEAFLIQIHKYATSEKDR